MNVSTSRLRFWMVVLAVLTAVIVTGFYLFARLRARNVLKDVATNKLGVDVQQSSEGFSFSKSEGGHTLYTIRASHAVQYKENNRATLKDVSIIVYGRGSDRFDQIYGSDFDYDPGAGIVAARGEVHIDLQGNAEGAFSPDQATPRELRNPIHVVTNGLVFNQKTGIARADGIVEFRVPGASGHARGATYDSHTNVLVLDSQVEVQMGREKSTTLHASHGSITKEPRSITLNDASITQQTRQGSTKLLQLELDGGERDPARRGHRRRGTDGYFAQRHDGARAARRTRAGREEHPA